MMPDLGQLYVTMPRLMALTPRITIFTMVPGFNLFGDGLRDAPDPRED